MTADAPEVVPLLDDDGELDEEEGDDDDADGEAVALVSVGNEKLLGATTHSSAAAVHTVQICPYSERDRGRERSRRSHIRIQTPRSHQYH